MRALYAVALAALTLSACASPTGAAGVVPSPSRNTPQLRAGFYRTVSTSAQGGTSITVGRPYSVAVFQIDDSYITSPLSTVTLVQAMAYFDTANRATLPSPLPVVAWSTSGNIVPSEVENSTPSPAPPGQNVTVIGTLNIHSPTKPGITTILAAVPGQNAAPFTALAYPALGISVRASSPYGVQYLAFDASGAAQPTDATHADLSAAVNAGETTISSPYGMEVVSKGVAGVTVSDYDPAKIQRSVNASDLCKIQASTLLITISDGRFVKWSPSAVSPNDCAWTDAQGPYLVSSGGAFPY